MELKVIARIRTDFKEKFGIPRLTVILTSPEESFHGPDLPDSRAFLRPRSPVLCRSLCQLPEGASALPHIARAASPMVHRCLKTIENKQDSALSCDSVPCETLCLHPSVGGDSFLQCCRMGGMQRCCSMCSLRGRLSRRGSGM